MARTEGGFKDNDLTKGNEEGEQKGDLPRIREHAAPSSCSASVVIQGQVLTPVF